jgi:hypothetical protein
MDFPHRGSMVVMYNELVIYVCASFLYLEIDPIFFYTHLAPKFTPIGSSLLVVKIIHLVTFT